MSGKLKRGIKDLVEHAKAQIREMPASEAVALASNPDWLIVDVREARERERDGFIPGSFHCARGMVEFWIDPDSPYFKPIFAERKNLLFHCALDWRSALTVQTIKDMGVENATHLVGGLKAWKESGGPLAFAQPKPPTGT